MDQQEQKEEIKENKDEWNDFVNRTREMLEEDFSKHGYYTENGFVIQGVKDKITLYGIKQNEESEKNKLWKAQQIENLNSLNQEDRERLIEYYKLEKSPFFLNEIVWSEDGKVRLKTEVDEENARVFLRKSYEEVKEILKYYVDLREEYYSLVAYWILGTWIHDKFNTFPYLFINATRGSGKTRLLKLIESLSRSAHLVVAPTEAVIFRMPKGDTLLLDECEQIASKDKATLREQLNTGYKKGLFIPRIKKIKNEKGEEDFVVEKFESYRPTALANIWGMEDVLADRCITLILEKSSDPSKNLILEDFETNFLILSVKKGFLEGLVQRCRVFSQKGVLERWNNYVKSIYPTSYTLNTLYTLTTPSTPINEKEEIFFKKIIESGIRGRDLELFFSLFQFSNFLGESYFDELLKIGKELVNEKKVEQLSDSKDVTFLDFLAQKAPTENYTQVKMLVGEFRTFLGLDSDELLWCNTQWVGAALKRLGLSKSRRRLKQGIEVIINYIKVHEKIKYYREEKKEGGEKND